MGYDLHITRRAEWSEKGHDIGFDEWRVYVDADPEMHLDGFAEAKATNGETIRVSDPGIASWTGPSNRTAGIRCWFSWTRGRIDVRYSSDKLVFAKTWAISRHFKARVQGDEGEFYGEDGEPLPK